MRARLINRVGTRYSQSARWGTCPTREGSGHFAEADWPTFGIDETYTPASCQDCATPYDGSRLWRGAGSHPLYDTGPKPEPGDLFWVDDRDGYCSAGWSNCDGHHLHAILPNAMGWDIDGRATNCGLPGDKEHRCWVRHGEPPEITVDKDGPTCPAGAGSIHIADWHGFLRNGEFA